MPKKSVCFHKKDIRVDYNFFFEVYNKMKQQQQQQLDALLRNIASCDEVFEAIVKPYKEQKRWGWEPRHLTQKQEKQIQVLKQRCGNNFRVVTTTMWEMFENFLKETKLSRHEAYEIAKGRVPNQPEKEFGVHDNLYGALMSRMKFVKSFELPIDQASDKKLALYTDENWILLRRLMKLWDENSYLYSSKQGWRTDTAFYKKFVKIWNMFYPKVSKSIKRLLQQRRKLGAVDFLTDLLYEFTSCLNDIEFVINNSFTKTLQEISVSNMGKKADNILRLGYRNKIPSEMILSDLKELLRNVRDDPVFTEKEKIKAVHNILSVLQWWMVKKPVFIKNLQLHTHLPKGIFRINPQTKTTHPFLHEAKLWLSALLKMTFKGQENVSVQEKILRQLSTHPPQQQPQQTHPFQAAAPSVLPQKLQQTHPFQAAAPSVRPQQQVQRVFKQQLPLLNTKEQQQQQKINRELLQTALQKLDKEKVEQLVSSTAQLLRKEQSPTGIKWVMVLLGSIQNDDTNQDNMDRHRARINLLRFLARRRIDMMGYYECGLNKTCSKTIEYILDIVPKKPHSHLDRLLLYLCLITNVNKNIACLELIKKKIQNILSNPKTNFSTLQKLKKQLQAITLIINVLKKQSGTELVEQLKRRRDRKLKGKKATSVAVVPARKPNPLLQSDQDLVIKMQSLLRRS